MDLGKIKKNSNNPKIILLLSHLSSLDELRDDLIMVSNNRPKAFKQNSLNKYFILFLQTVCN